MQKFGLSRILRHLNAVRRSLRFGFVVLRRRTFAIPASIKLGQQRISMQYPRDLGAKEDFLTCFVDDAYGLASLTSQPRTVLDIGSNVGFFSVAARGYFPNAVIHAYEPNPRVLGDLGANAAAGTFQVYPEAVGAAAGWVSIIDDADSNQATTSALGKGANGAVEQVAFHTAVERLGGQVDILKMDCEGAEWEIFSDVDAWISVRELRMEYHLTQGKKVFDVFETLRALSFRVIRHVDQGTFGLIWASRV